MPIPARAGQPRHLDPEHHARPWAILAGPLSLALEPIGTAAAEIGYGVMAWAHIGLVLAFGALGLSVRGAAEAEAGRSITSP